MIASVLDRSVSRRTALAGFGAGALGLMLTTPGFARNQEATPAASLAAHPIVGAWLITRYPGTSDEGQEFGIFAETGLYAALLWDRNVVVGEWRPTDMATVELCTFTKWLIPFNAYFDAPPYEPIEVPDVVLTSEKGTAEVPEHIVLDAGGATFASTGVVWLYDEHGTYTNSFGISSIGERLTVAAPTATPTA
jgi:hypothetical protein